CPSKNMDLRKVIRYQRIGRFGKRNYWLRLETSRDSRISQASRPPKQSSASINARGKATVLLEAIGSHALKHQARFGTASRLAMKNLPSEGLRIAEASASEGVMRLCLIRRPSSFASFG